MIEINLIPDVKQEYLRARRLRNAVVSLAITIGIGMVGLAAVLGLVFGGQLVAEKVQDRSIAEKREELTSIEDLNKVVTIQHQLGLIDNQHANKTIHSRVFDLMNAINPKKPNNVSIASLAVDVEESEITIDGTAENGYTALEAFKKTILNTYIQVGSSEDEDKVGLAEEIIGDDTSFGENADGKRVLRFSFSFEYPDELFANSEESVTILTPSKKINVTDSKLGVPETLFKTQAEDINEEEDE